MLHLSSLARVPHPELCCTKAQRNVSINKSLQNSQNATGKAAIASVPEKSRFWQRPFFFHVLKSKVCLQIDPLVCLLIVWFVLVGLPISVCLSVCRSNRLWLISVYLQACLPACLIVCLLWWRYDDAMHAWMRVCLAFCVCLRACLPACPSIWNSLAGGTCWTH